MIRIWMRKKDSDGSRHARLLILVDESNVGSSVRTAGRGLDWLKLREFLAGPNTGRDLIEMVDFSLPPFVDRNYRDDQHPATPSDQSDSPESLTRRVRDP